MTRDIKIQIKVYEYFNINSNIFDKRNNQSGCQ